MKYINNVLIIVLFTFTCSFSQGWDDPLKIFGYFQNEFEYQKGTAEIADYDQNTFVLQQLNLFFQKDFSEEWTSFVNFEILNSFSFARNWGEFNIEEAWVKYRASRQFNLKLGLQVPVFNNFNEIKNRTPLIPYIIRPLVYETSFNEFIAVDEYAPKNAFVQAYGYIPSGSCKFDYALYLGNTANIRTLGGHGVNGRSGTDTTSSVLVGGRIGIRYGDIKFGISGTRDIINEFGIYPDTSDRTIINPRLKERPRVRIGADFSFNYNNFNFESEYIQVTYDFNTSEINYDKYFYYATLGYYFSDPFFVYLGYWKTEENFPPYKLDENQQHPNELDVSVPNIGFAYSFNDKIVGKYHYAYVGVTSDKQEDFGNRFFHFVSFAVSVFF